MDGRVMLVVQRSAHPALSPTPAAGGVLAGLREQPTQLHAGIYWLSEVHQREKRTDGARYARLILDDAQGVILGLLWPEWLYQLADLRLSGPVFVTGTLQGPSWDRILHIERIRPLRPEERDGGARLLPRRLCPPVAQQALDALVALENALPEALRRFLGDVMRDPKIGIPLLRCKASQKHHHAYPGGLLVHSMEMMCLVDPLVQALMPFEPKAADLTRLGLLLHDVGKVLTVGESVRPRWPVRKRLRPSHEAVGRELLRPHLARLALCDHESAEVLGYLFDYLASDYTTRGYPTSLVVELVRMLDQLSTAVSMGKGLLPIEVNTR